jgi:hypothetical protein
MLHNWIVRMSGDTKYGNWRLWQCRNCAAAVITNCSDPNTDSRLWQLNGVLFCDEQCVKHVMTI